MKLFITFLVLSVLFSCGFEGDPNKEIDEGKVENGTYHSSAIGWTMDIPDGWSITTMAQTDQHLEKGSEIFEEELGVEIDYSELQNLIAFQKDQMNTFSSTSQLWVEDSTMTWDETNAELKVLLMEVYQGQNIPVDSSLTRMVEIDGVPFSYYTFSISTPDGSPLFKQAMYSALIKGYDFSASMTYSNEKDKNEMMEVWMNSKFE